MARVADKMAYVRSFAHSNSGHGGGTHWVMTGYDFPPADNGQAQIKPGLGSILARQRGANNPRHRPADLRPPGRHPRRRPLLARLRLRSIRHRRQCPQQHEPQVPLDRLGDRRVAAQGLRHARPRNRPQRPACRAWTASSRRPSTCFLSRAREAFDVTREDPRIRDLYGTGTRPADAAGPPAVRGGRRLRHARTSAAGTCTATSPRA